MASERTLHAKEDRRIFTKFGESVDIPFLILVLLLLAVGLTMLYSASYAQSEYDTGYEISTKYLQKQAVRYLKKNGEKMNKLKRQNLVVRFCLFLQNHIL